MVIHNIAFLCVNGTVVQDMNIALKKMWLKRSTMKAGTKDVKYTPLVEASKILLSHCI